MHESLESGQYEIHLNGHLDDSWIEWFACLSLTHQTDGTTIFLSPEIDQAALHGLLRKIRDLGTPLLAVIRIELDVKKETQNG